jgi:hypothetical protein
MTRPWSERSVPARRTKEAATAEFRRRKIAAAASLAGQVSASSSRSFAPAEYRGGARCAKWQLQHFILWRVAPQWAVGTVFAARSLWIGPAIGPGEPGKALRTYCFQALATIPGLWKKF